MSKAPLTPAERGHLAAEYAIGLLDGEALNLARALERDSEIFRAEVGAWLGRLAPLLDDVEPVTAPASLLTAIERRIGNPAAEFSNVVSLRRKLVWWRSMTVGASALAASLALVLLVRPPADRGPLPPPTTIVPPMIAAIGDERGAAMVASYNAGERSLVVMPAAEAAATVDPSHSHELWLIPAGGAPQSIGVMPAGTMRMTVREPMASAMRAGATLAISLEPLGGSPTGAPTGPVIASGTLKRA